MTDARHGRATATRLVLAVLGFYRTAISPLRPPTCRYTPSCSAYAVEALERFGLARGGWLALRRLLRCHPFHAGGHDPVPSVVDVAGCHPALRDGAHRDVAVPALTRPTAV